MALPVFAATAPVVLAIAPSPALAAAPPNANNGNAIFYLFFASSVFFLRCSISILT
jgi:hypothetical protein